MQRIYTVVGGLLALHAVALGAPQPKITELVPGPGIPLGERVAATAFCDTSRRAALLLDTGEVLAIDATGTKTSLGVLGAVGPRAVMACDHRDRIVVGRKGELVVLEGGAISTIKAPLGAPIGARTLDDGTVAFVSNGSVVHWDGTQVDDWSFAPPQFLDRPVVSGDGRALAGGVRGVTTIFDATGTAFTPPRAGTVAWAPDNQSLIAMTTQGLVRWKLGALPTDVTVLDAKVRGFQLTSAGNRIVVAGMSSGQILEFDAKGAQVGTTLSSTRWPSAFAAVAAGKADFAVVTADRAAHVLDLTAAGSLIDDQHATTVIRALAFSPDGSKLVFSGTPKELTVADARTGAITERLPVKAISIDQLRWTRTGIIAAGFRTLIAWSRDRVTEGTKSATESIDDTGVPIDGAAGCAKLPPPDDVLDGRGGPPAPIRVDAAGGYFAASCRQGLTVFRTKDLAIIAATTERSYAFALVGTRAVYAKGRDLHVVDAKGDRRVFTLPVPTGTTGGAIVSLVASRDRRHLAIATNGELAIVDAARLLPIMVTPATNISGIAWSPDGKRLAVALHAAIETWTLPKL